MPGRLSDEVLSERLRRGDHAAFATLTIRYWAPVHRIARNMLPQQSEADEVAEHAFLQALQSPGWFPRDAPFKVSLYRLAIVLSIARRQPRPAFRANRSDAERIRESLDRVEDLDRAAFVLRVIEEVPLQEAAAILRTSSETIRDRAHRACLLLTGLFPWQAQPAAPRRGLI